MVYGNYEVTDHLKLVSSAAVNSTFMLSEQRVGAMRFIFHPFWLQQMYICWRPGAVIDEGMSYSFPLSS
jgi:hypothetical protein